MRKDMTNAGARLCAPTDMDTSNLPELPRGWVWTKLGEISEIVLGQSPPSSTYNENSKGLPFYQGKLEFGAFYPVARKWCTSPKKLAQKGDVLISVRAPVGPTNICPEKSCIGRGLAAIRGLCDIETKFMLYLIRAFENTIAGKGTGTTFNAITGNQLKEFEIPLPPLAEQQRIVAKIEELFTKLDAGVAALRKVKAQLKRYRQAVLKHAFEGKLTAAWREAHKGELEPASVLLERIRAERAKTATVGAHSRAPSVPHSRAPSTRAPRARAPRPYTVDTSSLPQLPDGWVWTIVEEITEMMQYGTSEKANENPPGIPVIRMGNIRDGKLVLEDLKFFPANWSQLSDFVLQDGDILFNRTNSAELVGKTAVYREIHPKAVFASYLIRVRVNRRAYNPYILSYFINSSYGRAYIASVVSQQVGQANVNSRKLSLMPIPLPPLAEQHKIVEEIERRFSIADEVEKVVEQSLKQAERLRQSILKRAFEGKLVPQDPNDEPADKLLERIKQAKMNSVGAHSRAPNIRAPKPK